MTTEMHVCFYVLTKMNLVYIENVINNYNKDIQIPSKHNRFIILYHFRATCFDSLESSSGPLMN